MPKRPTRNRDEQAVHVKGAQTVKAHLEECYGPPHRWEYITKGHDPVGRHTKAGYFVNDFLRLRCLEHPEDESEVIVGVGEARNYCGLNLKRRKGGRPPGKRRDFDDFFATSVWP